MNLSKNVVVKRVGDYKEAENTNNIVGSDVDVSNYDGVLFFAYVEKGTASADENLLKVEQKDSDGNYSDLAGATAEAAEDEKVVAVDVYRPLASQGKELRATLDISTASKTGDLYAILYNGRVKPEDFADINTLVISPETA